MRKQHKQSIMLVLTIILALVLTGCGEATTKVEKNTETAKPEVQLLDSSQHPLVTMEMSNGGVVKIELYPEVAPNTVANFVSLVEAGFYDGLIFHRVIPQFMIQGGDPQGNGTGGPGYGIIGEFSQNGFENLLEHKRGVISMARSQHPDSAGSQFFIMHNDSPHLDGAYAAFGAVIEGMETVDEIAMQERNAADLPKSPISIIKATVDKKGLSLPELQIIE